MPIAVRTRGYVAEQLRHDTYAARIEREETTRSGVFHSDRAARIRSSVALLGLACSCTIVIDRPSSTPLSNPCDPAIPAPTAHIVGLVRVERSTADLRLKYGRWLETVGRGLMAAGIRPSSAALLRLDERGDVAEPPLGVFGCEAGAGPAVADVIGYYAANAFGPDVAASHCALSQLVRAGRNMPEVVASWPSDLWTSGELVRAFGAAPDLVVVIALDTDARRFSLDDAECTEALELSKKTTDGDAGWIEYAPRECTEDESCAASRGRVAMDRVFHYFIATDEGIDRETFLDRCRKIEGFPLTYLDELEPSERSLYSPLAERISDAGGQAEVIPMCSILSKDRERAILRDMILGIVEAMDHELSTNMIERVLNGDPLVPDGEAGP
ncbi:MAG: hypothetical protein HYV07_04660 [Deltaproteobacteria bacterium]|nr:hypothetical protein [Deltaproteobacteria bacterium]